MPDQSTVALTSLKPGDGAIVVDVSGEGAFRRRLMDMGFTKGAFVRVIKHAPLRNPIEYCIGGTHVTLRQQEAEHIAVRQVELPPWCRKYGPGAGELLRRRRRHGRGWRRREGSR